MSPQSRSVGLPSFLLTRPAAQSTRFADELRARFGPGIGVVASPLLVPRWIDAPIPARPFTAVIFTSETAVKAARRLSADLPHAAWCVGDRTARAARAAGFHARSANGDAAALVTAILASGQPGPLLHLRGADTASDLARQIHSAGTETVQAVVYAQDPQPLTDKAAALLATVQPLIVPLFSPRTARIFVACPEVRHRRAPLWIAALSAAVAVDANAARPERLIPAASPDAPAMLDAIAALLAAEP